MEKLFELLRRAGFRKYLGISSDWAFFLSAKQSQLVWHFYSKGDFVIGFAEDDTKPTVLSFIFVHNPCSPKYVLVEKDWWSSLAGSDIPVLIEACSDTSLMPLCIHTNWAHKLVESGLIST